MFAGIAIYTLVLLAALAEVCTQLRERARARERERERARERAREKREISHA